MRAHFRRVLPVFDKGVVFPCLPVPTGVPVTGAFFGLAMSMFLAAILLCVPQPLDSPPPSFRAARRLVRLLDEHVRSIPGMHRLSTRRLMQGVSILAVVEWPAQPLFNVSLTRHERESLRRAARASVLASAAYSTFGVLLVEWARSPLQMIRAMWWMLCGLHRPRMAAFEIHTRGLGLRASDVLHAQWRPQLMDRQGDAGSKDVSPSTSTLAAYVPAHFIVLDHRERALILVIRGSLDLEDVVTIVEVEPTRHDERLLGRGCHGGMAAAARTLVARHERLLRDTLRRHPGYRLDLAGHSLGAGIATFAAVLLQRALPHLTVVHAYAFAPPCSLPLRESGRHDALVDAYVYAADVVPRLSVGSVHGLCEAVEVVTRRRDGRHDDGSRAGSSADATGARAEMHRRWAGLPRQSTRYPPGRLRQLEPVHARRRGGSGHEHRLLCPCRRGLGLLRVHPSMFRDHGFDRYACALASLAEQVQ